MAEGATADVYVLKKKHIEEELLKFPNMEKYMRSIAQEKHTYNKILINKIINKYNDPEQKKKLIEARLSKEVYEKTTYMSLKRIMQVKK